MARATFLPEASKTDFKFSGNTTEGDYNQATSCEDKSKLYTTSNCKYPRAVVSSSRCPFLAGYYTECKCLSQFNKTSCTAPYILGGTSCDGKYEKCVCPATVSLTSANDKCTQYCDGKCIKKSCTPTANQSNCTNGTQNCDNGCGQNTRKCCVACTHKITTKPANSSYTYSSCNDGSGSHQIQTGWKCNTGYHEKNGSCEKDCIAELAVGDILYSDMTTSSEVVSGKTPIGVVFDTSKKLAVALQDAGKLTWASHSGDKDITTLPDYTMEEALQDYGGKVNTLRIRAHGDSSRYSTNAADYCYEYSTLGTSQGDWYLPALGELDLINKNLNTVDTTLSKVGKKITKTIYWSSNESFNRAYGMHFAWSYDFRGADYFPDDVFKDSSILVRPVMNF